MCSVSGAGGASDSGAEGTYVRTAHGTYRRGAVARYAIRHSGDVLRGREGEHTIDVDLRALSDQVGSLYLTLSGWTTPLSRILRPEVRCLDPDSSSGEPIARYELDGTPTGEHTAVLMARVWRPAPGDRWRVTAIGELGMGRAGDYGPILRAIDAWQQKHVARGTLHAEQARSDAGDTVTEGGGSLGGSAL